jgi:chemotaxis protein MotB
MARQRRKVFVDANNHDRWIVSYADFITLLFAFFVVMYSISSVNEGKYKTLTDSLGTAFSSKEQQAKTIIPVTQNKPQPDASLSAPLTIPFEHKSSPQQTTATNEQEWELTTVSGNDLNPAAINQMSPFTETNQQTLLNAMSVAFDSVKTGDQIAAKLKNTQELSEENAKPGSTQSEATVNLGQEALADMLNVPFESADAPDNLTAPEDEKKRELSEEILKERKQLNQVSDQLEQSLAPFIKDDLIAIKRNDYWIELEMNSELLFLSGESALSPKAQPALKEIAKTINTLPNALNIEGHTDNIPINNLKFPSNWDLSSARATSVVQEFVKEGVDPTRLSAVGYGEFHPIGDNATEEGRFKNRRVTLVLMSQAFSRYGANDEERAKLLNLIPSTSNQTNPIPSADQPNLSQ